MTLWQTRLICIPINGGNIPQNLIPVRSIVKHYKPIAVWIVIWNLSATHLSLWSVSIGHHHCWLCGGRSHPYKHKPRSQCRLAEPEKKHCFPIKAHSFMRVSSHSNISNKDGTGHWNRRQRDSSWEEEEREMPEGAWQNAPCSGGCDSLWHFYVSCSAMWRLFT